MAGFKHSNLVSPQNISACGAAYFHQDTAASIHPRLRSGDRATVYRLLNRHLSNQLCRDIIKKPMQERWSELERI